MVGKGMEEGNKQVAALPRTATIRLGRGEISQRSGTISNTKFEALDNLHGVLLCSSDVGLAIPHHRSALKISLTNFSSRKGEKNRDKPPSKN